VFGDLLFIPPPGAQKARDFLSPEDLKGKIVISDAPATETHRDLGQLAKLLTVLHLKAKKRLEKRDEDNNGNDDVAVQTSLAERETSEELYGVDLSAHNEQSVGSKKGQAPTREGGSTSDNSAHRGESIGSKTGKAPTGGRGSADDGSVPVLSPAEELRRMGESLEEIPLGVDPHERIAIYRSVYGSHGAFDDETLRKIRKELEAEKARLTKEEERRERLARKAEKPAEPVPVVRKLLMSVSSAGKRKQGARAEGAQSPKSEIPTAEGGSGRREERPPNSGEADLAKAHYRDLNEEMRQHGGEIWLKKANSLPVPLGTGSSATEDQGKEADMGRKGKAKASETEIDSESQEPKATRHVASPLLPPRSGHSDNHIQEDAEQALLKEMQKEDQRNAQAGTEWGPLAIPVRPESETRAHPIDEVNLAGTVSKGIWSQIERKEEQIWSDGHRLR
jgi:hypothetical protein